MKFNKYQELFLQENLISESYNIKVFNQNTNIYTKLLFRLLHT